MNTFWLYYRTVKSFTGTQKLSVWWSWAPRKKELNKTSSKDTMAGEAWNSSVWVESYTLVSCHTQYGHHHVLHPSLIDSFVIDSLSLHVKHESLLYMHYGGNMIKLPTTHYITSHWPPLTPAAVCAALPAAGLQVCARTPPTTSAAWEHDPGEGPRAPKRNALKFVKLLVCSCTGWLVGYMFWVAFQHKTLQGEFKN